jgi:hypothetical protein
MKLEELLLRKEELPIITTAKRPIFNVPIHPRLLDDDLKTDPEIAHKVFAQVALEWYEELSQYTDRLGDKDMQIWYREVFIPHKPVIDARNGRQKISPSGMWEDMAVIGDNGFATGLSINRNAGGSLFVDVQRREQIVGPPTVLFSPEKTKEYATTYFPERISFFCHAYCHHNIDHYPGALFLRNWAIMYLNEAMRQAGEEKLNSRNKEQ